jgi:hypothetical protein
MPKAKSAQPAPISDSDRLQAISRRLAKQYAQAGAPPAIACKILLNYLPTLIEKIGNEHYRAVKAHEAALEASRQEAESSNSFAELIIWLRSTEADQSYLSLMEEKLRSKLDYKPVEAATHEHSTSPAREVSSSNS